MIAQYQIQKLLGLQQINPADVTFETASTCPVCASNDLADVSILTESLVTAWCRACRHMFHRRKPTAPWYRDWYDQNWDVAAPSQPINAGGPPALRNPRQSLFYFCNPALEPGFSVLDLGCGYGNDLVPFMEFGCDAFGVEASPHRAQAAQDAGIQTANVPAEQLSEQTFNRRFDLALSNHVLEHVFDPHAYMQSIRRVLKPGGWLCLTVPNAANDFMLHNFFFALHIHFFSRYSLENLLAAHGFVIHRVLEEHQLRILACYEPPSENHEELFDVTLEDTPRNPPVSAILASAFGPSYNQTSKPIHCHWEESTTRLRNAYEVTHDNTLRSDSTRAMSVTLSGEPTLPITFQSNSPSGAAPFWAK